MERAGRMRWGTSLLVTVLLILLMVGGSFWATSRVNRQEEEAAYQRLCEEAEELARDISERIQQDRALLEMIAVVMSHYPDPTDTALWEVFRTYDVSSTLSWLELLLPGDTLLTHDGQLLDVSGTLSFQEKAALGSHITDREADVCHPEQYIVRHYVPVVQNGETVAMLCGVVDLGSMPDALGLRPYGGQAAVYIMDANTGDLLLDTWHKDPGGNMWELGERPMAPGYDSQQFRQGLISGETGYVVFVSETTGEYLYFYYTPMQINRWQLALSVSQDVVFADANVVRGILNRLLLLEALGFVLYFLWMLVYVRRETGEKQRQLDTLNHIYDVERLLFNAHENPDNVPRALAEIGRMLAAGQVAFWMPEQDSFLWVQEDTSPSLDREDCARRLLSYFQAGCHQFEANHPQAVRALLPKADGIRNLVAVAVEDGNGDICGVLAAANLPARPSNGALLKSMGFSFSMFCRNMRSYHLMKELGEQDLLTGLYNRNRYEQDLAEDALLLGTPLACIFVDANGLHELNNAQGHTAGDRMLQAVAAQLREKFGGQPAYRIGGDEFLVFISGAEDAVRRMCQDFAAALDRLGIQVSVGLQWEARPASLEELVKAAEQKMYEAKRTFYENAQHDRRHSRSGQ